MAKVKIKNVCEDQCVGFSFKALKPNQTTVVDEEVITAADKRLLEKDPPLAIMEKWDGKIDKAPVQREIKDPEDDENEGAEDEKDSDSGEIITSGDKPKEADQIVTASDVKPIHEAGDGEATDSGGSAGADETGEETTDGDSAEETAEGAEDEATSTEEMKVYTREQLANMGRDELREVGKPLGVKGRSVEKLVEDILEAQSKAVKE